MYHVSRLRSTVLAHLVFHAVRTKSHDSSRVRTLYQLSKRENEYENCQVRRRYIHFNSSLVILQSFQSSNTALPLVILYMFFPLIFDSILLIGLRPAMCVSHFVSLFFSHLFFTSYRFYNVFDHIYDFRADIHTGRRYDEFTCTHASR